MPANIYGIAPGPALGFVAEGNQLLHLQAGIYEQNDLGTVPDVLVRSNYIRNAARGIDYQGNYPVQRLIIHDNLIEPSVGGIGIRAINNAAWLRFGTLIVRKNTIRSATWDQPTPGTIQHGVQASWVSNLDVEFNVIGNLAQGSADVAVANLGNPERIANNIILPLTADQS